MRIYIDLEKLNLASLQQGILSQSELAKKSDLTVQTISRLMNGESIAPLTLRKLCKTLKCEPSTIIKT